MVEHVFYGFDGQCATKEKFLQAWELFIGKLLELGATQLTISMADVGTTIDHVVDHALPEIRKAEAQATAAAAASAPAPPSDAGAATDHIAVGPGMQPNVGGGISDGAKKKPTNFQSFEDLYTGLTITDEHEKDMANIKDDAEKVGTLFSVPQNAWSTPLLKLICLHIQLALHEHAFKEEVCAAVVQQCSSAAVQPSSSNQQSAVSSSSTARATSASSNISKQQQAAGSSKPQPAALAAVAAIFFYCCTLSARRSILVPAVMLTGARWMSRMGCPSMQACTLTSGTKLPLLWLTQLTHP